MGPFEIALIVFCGVVVIGVVVSRIVRKKKGKSSCDCGCSDCASCAYCAEAKRKQTKN